MRMSLKVNSLTVMLLILSSSVSRAADPSFATLAQCWTGVSGGKFETDISKLKNDFHLAHVLRFDAKNRSSLDTVLGKDNFMVFNSEGAQLLTPNAIKEPEEKRNSYQMILTPPGETSRVKAAYFVSWKSGDGTRVGQYQPVESENSKAPEAKAASDQVKTLDFAQARDILKLVMRDSVDKLVEKQAEAVADLNNWVYEEKDTLGNTVTTKERDERILIVAKWLDDGVAHLKACNDVREETIRSAAAKHTAYLEHIRSNVLTGGPRAARISPRKPAD